eukprot:726338-Hanusia_phi.AAC.3
MNNVKPGISIYLKEGHFEDEHKAKAISNKIEYLNLRLLVKHAEIHYEPNPLLTRVPEDQAIVEAHYELADEPPKDMSPWVLRFVLDNPTLDGKDMYLSEVVAKIKETYHTGRDEFEIIASDDNADLLVIRLRLLTRSDHFDEDDEEADDETEDHFLRKIAMDMLDTITLRGIPDIPRVLIEQDKLYHKLFSPDDPKYEKYNKAVPSYLYAEGNNLLRVLSFAEVDQGPLMRCTFEETVEILLEAAAFSMPDRCLGVAENVILGNLCPLGTGSSFELFLNTESCLEAVPVTHDDGDVTFSPVVPTSPQSYGYQSPAYQDIPLPPHPTLPPPPPTLPPPPLTLPPPPPTLLPPPPTLPLLLPTLPPPPPTLPPPPPTLRRRHRTLRRRH